VHSLYKIIAVDQRHIDVRILIEGEIPQRNFTDWSMTFQRMQPRAFENLTGFQFLSEYSNMTEIKDHHHPAIIFLKQLYEKNHPLPNLPSSCLSQTLSSKIASDLLIKTAMSGY
jgi:hypothetical protein